MRRCPYLGNLRRARKAGVLIPLLDKSVVLQAQIDTARRLSTLRSNLVEHRLVIRGVVGNGVLQAGTGKCDTTIPKVSGGRRCIGGPTRSYR